VEFFDLANLGMQASLARSIAPHVTVIGAGLVGLTSAEALLRHGFQVTLVDRQDQVASECSFGNAAMFMRGFLRPKTAAPSDLLQWATRRSEPVHVSWRAMVDPQMMAFGLRFFLAGPQRFAQIRNVTQVSGQLALLSTQQFEAIRKEYCLQTGIVEGGLLMFFRDSTKLKAVIDDQVAVYSPQEQQELFRVVSARECVEIEPALAPQEAELSGGIHWTRDKTVCPLAFSRELATKLSSGDMDLRLSEQVNGLSQDGGHVIVKTSKGEFETQAVVVAAGVQTGQMLRHWRLSDLPPTPLYGMRGHSLTLDVSHLVGQDRHVLSRTVCDGDSMTWMSPLPMDSEASPKLRVTGFGDFDGWDYGPGAIRTWRLAQLQAAAQKTIPALLSPAAQKSFQQPPVAATSLEGLCTEADVSTRWCGLRPMSPDSLPLVGRISSQAPIYINTGHGSNGWSLSPACAELLALRVGHEIQRSDAPKEPIGNDAWHLLQHLDPHRFTWSRVLQSARSQWFSL